MCRAEYRSVFSSSLVLRRGFIRWWPCPALHWGSCSFFGLLSGTLCSAPWGRRGAWTGLGSLREGGGGRGLRELRALEYVLGGQG